MLQQSTWVTVQQHVQGAAWGGPTCSWIRLSTLSGRRQVKCTQQKGSVGVCSQTLQAM